MLVRPLRKKNQGVAVNMALVQERESQNKQMKGKDLSSLSFYICEGVVVESINEGFVGQLEQKWHVTEGRMKQDGSREAYKHLRATRIIISK